MNKFISRAVLVAALVASVYAIDNLQSETSAAAVAEDRRIHKHRLPFYASIFGLGGLGGMNALAVLFAVKIKLLIVAAIVGLSVYYFSHTRSNSWGETIVPYSAYSEQGPIAYSASPSFISSDHHHGGGVEYSSYPGPDPYSAYYPDAHPELSSSSGPAGYSGYPSSPSSYGHNDRSSSVAAYDSIGAKSKHSRSRAGATQPSSGGRQKRQAPADFDAVSLLNSINWGEIAFQFLGVDTMGCRRRFVCEFDFRAARNPFTRMAYTLIGKNFFDKYRDLSTDSVRPAMFSDCARLHRECAAAEEYNDVDDAELHDVKAAEPVATTVEDMLDNEVVEYDGDSLKKEAENGRSLSLSESGVNAHDVGQIIMLRAEQ